jgi:hypothetical protein
MPSTSSRDRRARQLTALVAWALAVAATASPAAATPSATSAVVGSGDVALTVDGNGKAAKGLRAGGVEVAPVKPATKRGKRIALPVQNVTVGGESATVVLRGGVAFKAGKRSLKLSGLRVKLTTERATVSAMAGKSRATVLAATLPKGKAKLDSSKLTARLVGAKLALTPKGARLLRSKLAISDIPAGALGKLGVDAKPRSGGGTGGTGGGTGGSGQGGGPVAGPIKNELPILARPAGAVDVTGASLNWRPRVSWLCYIASTSVFGGTVNGPTETLPCPPNLGGPRDLVGSFKDFPFKNGWYHAATGTAAIYFQGGVGFRYPAHGINFSSANPEVEINPGASRAIFTFNGSEGTKYDNQRGVLVDLHPSAIQTPPSGEVTYDAVPATVPADAGASVFAGFYAGGDEFGSLSVSFTVPAP